MTTVERVAYLKGLAEGMKLDESTNEAKLLLKIIDTLEDIVMDLSDVGDDLAEVSQQVDEIDDDLAAVEDLIYGDEDEDDDDDEDETIYEVECPTCGDVICLNEEMLEEGEIDCPNCGEKLEFDLDDDCDCESCNGKEE